MLCVYLMIRFSFGLTQTRYHINRHCIWISNLQSITYDADSTARAEV